MLSAWSNTATWLIDLAANWQWIFLGGLVSAGAISVCRHTHWLVAFLAIPLPWLTAASALPNSGQISESLSVVASNVHFENLQPQQLLDWLRAENVDIAVLVEVSPRYASALSAAVDYPYQTVVARTDPFGMAVLSRIPLVETQTVEESRAPVHIESAFYWQGNKVKIVAFHPMPPITPAYQQQRDKELRRLSDRLEGGIAIIAGDFNATPWSTAFAGLNSIGLGRASGLSPTWPVAGWGVLGIPIDNVFATRHWKVAERAIGPDVGSDHFPVLVRLNLDASM